MFTREKYKNKEVQENRDEHIALAELYSGLDNALREINESVKNVKDMGIGVPDEVVKIRKEARDLGQLVRNYNDEKWDKVRVDRMRTAVRYKFYQNEDLRKRLMDTKYEGKTFVEASYYDRIWGVGYNENDAPDHVDNWGRNELGKILTDLRNEFKAKRS